MERPYSAMDPMDVDPIDGGPRTMKAPPPSVSADSNNLATATSSNNNNNNNNNGGVVVEEEIEARQAIDMLRGDDLSARVAAAHRLDAVADALGQQRARDVSLFWLFIAVVAQYSTTLVLFSFFVFWFSVFYALTNVRSRNTPSSSPLWN